jgi:hypothetical protein
VKILSLGVVFGSIMSSALVLLWYLNLFELEFIRIYFNLFEFI